jgi:hypothetical protein
MRNDRRCALDWIFTRLNHDRLRPIDAGEVNLLAKIGTTKAEIDRLCTRLQSKAPHVRIVRDRSTWLRAVPSARPEGLRLHGLRTFTDPPQGGRPGEDRPA